MIIQIPTVVTHTVDPVLNDGADAADHRSFSISFESGTQARSAISAGAVLLLFDIPLQFRTSTTTVKG